MQILLRAALAFGTLSLGLACASPTPDALLGARAAYQKAAGDPNVNENASVELYEAKQALDRADTEWTKQGNREETEHLAYLARRRVELAESWASARQSVKEAEALAKQRDKVLLEARTGEVERALTAAQKARAEAEARAREAEEARRAAEEAAEREKKLREELADLQARETERGLVLTLGDILFDVDRAELKPGAMQNLYRLVTFLKEYPDRGVLVEGHTDSTGSDAYNLSLSQRRADSVKSFLVTNGVAPERVVARGYGKGYPIASNDTAAGRQRNRRVEIVILKAGERPEDKIRPPAP
jgi:OOP family OmpA-OmpF porin